MKYPLHLAAPKWSSGRQLPVPSHPIAPSTTIDVWRLEGKRLSSVVLLCSTWYGGLFGKQFKRWCWFGDRSILDHCPKKWKSCFDAFKLLNDPPSIGFVPSVSTWPPQVSDSSSHGLCIRAFLEGSASGIGPRVILVQALHRFGSVTCVTYHPFNHCRFTSKAQGVQTLQNDFKNVIVKGHPDWKNLHKNCPPHKTDTLPGALLPRYCHDRCFLLPPPTQPSLGGLWLEVLEVTGRTSAFFW